MVLQSVIRSQFAPCSKLLQLTWVSGFQQTLTAKDVIQKTYRFFKSLGCKPLRKTVHIFHITKKTTLMLSLQRFAGSSTRGRKMMLHLWAKIDAKGMIWWDQTCKFLLQRPCSSEWLGRWKLDIYRFQQAHFEHWEPIFFFGRACGRDGVQEFLQPAKRARQQSTRLQHKL